ncbi:MAG: carbohydrate ABC transporter permease [Lachnospiraceae bacterium]
MTKKTPGYWVLNVVSILLALIFIAPIFWALMVSFQREGKPITSVVDWFTPPYTLENYPQIIMNSSVPTWLINSLIIAVIVTALTVIFSAMAAYALAKLKFKGSNAFFMYFLIGILVPGEATIVPLFITVNSLHMINTYAGMILPSIAGSMNLIIMITFFRNLPDELLEAAKIDGAGEVRIFFQIALPLSKTIIATVCIFAFVGSWNNYLWPLLCAMSENLFTLPIGIPTFAGTYSVDYVQPLTACMVASLPMIIMYIIFERQIVAGITSGAVKG